MSLRRPEQQGFTLIELLIATTIFSVILLVASAALIQIGRMYYKGIITSKTQNAARLAIDDISRSIQFSSGNKRDATLADSGNPPVQAICFGSTRFTYILRSQVSSDPSPTQVRHALWRDNLKDDACDVDMPNLRLANPYEDAGDDDRQGQALLEAGMRLQIFTVDSLGGANDAYSIRVKVVYGDDDLLNEPENPTNTSCKGNAVGGQWCAVSDLSSVVYSRVKP